MTIRGRKIISLSFKAIDQKETEIIWYKKHTYCDGPGRSVPFVSLIEVSEFIKLPKRTIVDIRP